MTYNVLRKFDRFLIKQYSSLKEAEAWVNLYSSKLKREYLVELATEANEPENMVDEPVAVKHDQQKPDYSLLPLADLEGLVEVLQYGAKKYTRNNWKSGGGHDPNRLIAACLRHLALFQDGQAVDSESGLSHIHHAACNLVFLMRQIRLAKVNEGNSDSVTKGDTE